MGLAVTHLEVRRMNLKEQETSPLSDYRTIPLSQGKFAVVSSHRYEELNQWKWCASKAWNTWYAVRKNEEERMIQMHRQILGLTDPKIQTDHWDGNGLNNRDENLRLAKNLQNSWNRSRHKDNTTGFIGVVFHKRARKFQARLHHNGKCHYLGLFDLAEDAAHARDIKAIELHGEFARLNFPCQ